MPIRDCRLSVFKQMKSPLLSGLKCVASVILPCLSLLNTSANASQDASALREKFQLELSSGDYWIGEPQLRVLSWDTVSRSRSAARLEPLMSLRELVQFAQPNHPSALTSAFDVGGYLYNPESSLGIDPSYVRLMNRDDLQLLPELPMRAYFGLLHSHTFASDGTGSTEAAFRTARDVAKLDFFAVTDHSEYWFTKQNSEFRSQTNLAARESRSDFVGLAGFEYSHTLFGHVVVLNSYNWTNAFMTPTWKGFFEWLSMPEQNQTLAIFAHPGFHRYRTWFDLEHFSFDARLREKFVGVEFIHRNVWRRSMNGFSGKRSFVDEALQKGWHVGPIASQDNHTEFWGIADGNRIALLTDKLSKQNVLDALRARRFYSTQSPQLQLAAGIYNHRGDFLGTLGERIDARHLNGKEGFLRVRLYDPNPHEPLCRFDLLVDGERTRSLSFLDSPSGGFFVAQKNLPSTHDPNCSPQGSPQVWWEKLFNNGVVTGRPFEWFFASRAIQESEVLEILTPLGGFSCSGAKKSTKRSWSVAVRLLHSSGGEKLTLTSPMSVHCDDSKVVP